MKCMASSIFEFMSLIIIVLCHLKRVPDISIIWGLLNQSVPFTSKKDNTKYINTFVCIICISFVCIVKLLQGLCGVHRLKAEVVCLGVGRGANGANIHLA